MRATLFKFLAPIALTLLTGFVHLPAQNRGQLGYAIVYTEENYRGTSYRIEGGKSIASLAMMRSGALTFQGRRIRSLELHGDAVLELWDRSNYQGRSIIISTSQSVLDRLGPAQENWKDRIASMKVYNEGGPASFSSQTVTRHTYESPPVRPQPNRGEVKLFDAAGYQGDSLTLDRAQVVHNLRDVKEGYYHWNDRISSIYINGPYTVVLYKAKNFEGDSVRISQSVPNLRNYRDAETGTRGWNDEVSSIEIVEEQTKIRRPAPEKKTIASLYKADGYQGDQLPLHEGQEIRNLKDYGFNDEVSSVVVQQGYEVHLWEASDFKGAKIVLDEHTPSLKRQRKSSRRWNDVASSVKVIATR